MLSRQFGPVSEFMINSYCASLASDFAQLVHFGLLDDGDGQCFRVNSTIEGGSFVLLIGAVMLVILNSVVSMAVEQCLHDKMTHPVSISNESEESSSSERNSHKDESDESEGGGKGKARTKIKPGRVLFTDMYGWAFCKETGAQRSEARLKLET